jgi:hypothetical protein
VNYVFFFFVGPGFKFKALYLQNRRSTPWATPPVHFVLVILEMVSRELFAWAGLRLQSSWSAFQVARIIGVSHWCTAWFSNIVIFVHPSKSNLVIIHYHLNTLLNLACYQLHIFAPFLWSMIILQFNVLILWSSNFGINILLTFTEWFGMGLFFLTLFLF